MNYRRAGASGLLLPEISLGLWQNFGEGADERTASKIVLTAFDHGITYFDLADNYGPPTGRAEECFAKIMKHELAMHRDEIVVATKAGHDSWPGPYGSWGSRKHLLASIDNSLRRLGLDYVDIFYHHRPDPSTPLEETMDALVQMVRSGKALYVALSKYELHDAVRASEILARYGIHPILNQLRYSIVQRDIDRTNIALGLENEGIGIAVFSPLAQGLLTDKYLSGDIPKGSRGEHADYIRSTLTEGTINKLQALNSLAYSRGQSLSEMAIAWLLSRINITTVIVGARTEEQLLENIGALSTPREFLKEENDEIESYFIP